jgi:hypothetical protein
MRRLARFVDAAVGPVIAAYFIVNCWLVWGPLAVVGLVFLALAIFELIHLWVGWRFDRPRS